MTDFGDDLPISDGVSDVSAVSGAFSAEMRRMREEMRATGAEAKTLSTTLGGSLKGAFDRLVFGGGKASDVLKQLGRDMSGRLFNSAIKPVQSAVGDGLGSLISGGLGSLLGGTSLFADGAAFSAGQVRAFAGGGVVEGPTMFPMRGGAAGLMGEAGPEAILPLQRGPDGRLGVASGGGGGSRVTVNISTPDIDGFQRSRSQVAAQIARAVRFGQRHQ